MKIALAIILLQSSVCLCLGMDRLSALSQIETGDNDFAVGPNGELSRWQISLPVIAEYGISKAQLTNAAYARVCVQHIMADRVTGFATRHARLLSDAEYDLLWHRPAHVLKPTRADRARAQRFANLVSTTDGHR